MNREVKHTDTKIYPTETIFDLIEEFGSKSQIVRLNKCMCRLTRKHQDKACKFNLPDEMSCITFGEDSQYWVDYGHGQIISKEEALIFFKDAFPDQKQLLEGLKDNPLPASIDVQLKDTYQSPDQVRNFALKVKTIPGVNGVEYGQSWIEGYASFLSFIKSAGLVVGVGTVLAEPYARLEGGRLRSASLPARADRLNLL